MGKVTYKVTYQIGDDISLHDIGTSLSEESIIDTVKILMEDVKNTNAKYSNIKLNILVDSEVDRVYYFKNFKWCISNYFGLCSDGKHNTCKEAQHFSDLYENLVKGESEPKKVYWYQTMGDGGGGIRYKFLDEALTEIHTRSRGKQPNIELHVFDGDKVVLKFSFCNPNHNPTGFSCFYTTPPALRKPDSSDLNKQYTALVAKLEQKEDMETYQVSWMHNNNTGRVQDSLQNLKESLFRIYARNKESCTDIKLSILKNGVVDRWFAFNKFPSMKPNHFTYDGSEYPSSRGSELNKEATILRDMYAEIIAEAEGEKKSPNIWEGEVEEYNPQIVSTSNITVEINQTTNKQESQMGRLDTARSNQDKYDGKLTDLDNLLVKQGGLSIKRAAIDAGIDIDIVYEEDVETKNGIIQKTSNKSASLDFGVLSDDELNVLLPIFTQIYKDRYNAETKVIQDSMKSK